ncbi:TonB-dependent receptor [Paraflavitalea sp. CAU 1676]|uniref:SusC/RagA family TonB-linked outer membrane protein n=1 Tax=Paraflavitalea sp. CAU 1676 TaxID=3032598 RepID=UPI0023DABB11|nr:TonB-dependent receptor [Paraflavitalea sp. CAU 1676]MDF2193492.1 TonB-dependent receptor [Paraflavitalea sp. CAU 1676]
MSNVFLKTLSVIACLLVLPYWLSAQNVTVTATVKLPSGELAEGASVTIKGSKRGTATNSKGVFVYEAKPSDVIVISFSGYKILEYKAGSMPTTIYLQPVISDLDDVVIIGYESKKKRDLTTSVTKVDTKNNTEGGYSSFQQLIGGRAAGVQVLENSTDPGGGVSVEIRGIGSISFSSQPLYVVDGIPLNSPDLNLTTGASSLVSPSTSNPLTMINPNDIETIEILKDAAATAIYGARGANGVVLITTKSGKAGKINVSLNANYSMTRSTRSIKVLNGRDYATFMNEYWAYRKAIGYNTTAIQPYLPEEIDSLPTYDHQKDIQQTAPTTDIYMSVSGGDAKNKVFFSGQYYNQVGMIPSTSLNRYNGKLSYEGKLRPDLTFTMSTNYTNSVRNGQPTTILSNKVLGWPSSVPLVNPDGGLNYLALYQYGNGQATTYDATRGITVYYNPRFAANEARSLAYTNHPFEFGGSNQVKNVQTSTQLLTNIGLAWSINNHLNVSAKLGLTTFNALLENYTPSIYIGGSALKGAASAGNSQNTGLLYQLQANYNRRFGKDHILSAFVVASAEKFVSKTQTASTIGFTSDVATYHSLQSGSASNTPYTTYNANQLVSSIVSASYNYKSRYYLSASGRMDGTSKFTENERYGFFPAVSAAWRLNQEKWFSPLRSIFSDLKLRASWGIVGNQSIAPYSTISTLDVASVVFGNTVNVGFTPTNLSNPTLRWERTASVNLGADLSFFKDRFSLTAEVYRKRTNDLLYGTIPPLSSGYTFLTRNIASLTNEGIEFSAGWKVVNSKKVRWNLEANIGINRNRVDQLSGGKGEYQDISQVVTGAYLFRLQPGVSIGQFYGLKTIGVWTDKTILEKPAGFQTGAREGDRRYADLNNDGLLDDKDRTYLGSALPKYFGGFSSTISYKGLELATFFSYSVGNKIFDYYEFNTMSLNRGQANIRKDIFDRRYRMITPTMSAEEADKIRLHNERANIQVPGSLYDPRESTDLYLEDGTYLRCRDITLSWALPASWMKRIKVAGVKFYANCQNLFILTSYPGYNPEVNTSGGLARGVDGGTSPLGRVYRFGLNVNF